MKKTRLILSFIAFTSLAAKAQHQYAGYRTGNYTGVNGVFFNPSNIADSRYRWDINLFGLNAGVGNNNASFNLKTITKTLNDNADSLLLGNGEKAIKGMGNVDILGPSFMFNLNRKTSFALTSRVRALVNINDLDGELIKSIDEQSTKTTFPYNLNSNNDQSIAVNGWADFGLTMARVLVDNKTHFFKGGLTLKYLAGFSNSYVQVNKLNGTLNEDISGVYLTDASGGLNIGVGGVSIDDNFDAQDALKFNGSGFGGDIGFVYEYRPDASLLNQRDRNKYKLKIGLALLDVGRITYKPDPAYTSSYSINVNAAQKFYLNELNGKSISEMKTYLDGSPYFTSTTGGNGSYSVALPATLQTNIDLHLHRGFYVDLSGQLNLARKSKNTNAFYQNNVTLTPRYEGKAFGVYVPLNYNSVTNLNAGLSLRAGPLFIGSGSVVTALFDNSKQADFHVGVRFGNLFKKPKVKKETKPEAKVEEVPQKPQDTDGDGINDADDKCPNKAGVAKYNGCPVPDTDADGLNDEQDKCPTVAGVAKYNGCPVPDTDADGVNDEEDKCPAVAGVAKYNGCPVPDTDGDGVNDEKDKCPTLAGVAANQGCPEIKQEIIKKVHYAASHILFQTGKAVLAKVSYKQLDQVAKVMQEDKDLKLNIEGHTDAQGNDASNMLLSQKRADAIKTYLVNKGISTNQLTSKGLGETMPIADNKTAAGRAKNRRVELELTY